MKITKDMLLADVLAADENCAPIFLNAGMHCLGCPIAHHENLEEACAAHGIDVDKLVEELNNYFMSK